MNTFLLKDTVPKSIDIVLHDSQTVNEYTGNYVMIELHFKFNSKT